MWSFGLNIMVFFGSTFSIKYFNAPKATFRYTSSASASEYPTAYERFNEFDMDEMIYVVGNEQNYHFQVLSLICGKLGFAWANKIKHLSYGMVELPEGKMKSREGTVVDADDLMQEMIHTY